MNDPRREMQKALDACLCFNVRRAARLITQHYDTCLRPAGMRVTQFGLLALLGARGELTMSKLAEAAGMDRTTLTRNMRILRKQGWVKAARGGDSRERIVALNQPGIAALNEAFPLWQKAQASLRERLPGTDLRPFMATLGEVAEAAGEDKQGD